MVAGGRLTCKGEEGIGEKSRGREREGEREAKTMGDRNGFQHDRNFSGSL